MGAVPTPRAGIARPAHPNLRAATNTNPCTSNERKVA